MQRHVPAAAHVLLVVCVFGTSVLPATAQTTAQIERDVREELRGERDLRRLDVTVAGSEATLSGELETFWSKSEAIRRTLEVDGVETVVSQIEIHPPRATRRWRRRSARRCGDTCTTRSSTISTAGSTVGWSP